MSQAERPPFLPAALTAPTRDPGPLRIVKAAMNNPIDMWPRAVWEGETWQAAYPYPAGQIIVSDAASVLRVLAGSPQEFGRADVVRRAVLPLWGEGIVPSRGDEWSWQRRAAAAPFKGDLPLKHAQAFSAAASSTLERLCTSTGRVVDIDLAMTELVLAGFLDTTLRGCGGLGAPEDASRRFIAFNERLGRNDFSDFLPLPERLRPSTRNRGGRSAQALRDALVKLAADHRASAVGDDLVGSLTTARHPASGEAMSDQRVGDNLMGLTVAGHSTTAMTLAWALYLIANDEEVETRIMDEVTAVAGSGPISEAHLPSLSFLDQVIQETLRLYPPAPMIIRQALKEVELDGRRVKKGALVIVPVYALHHSRYLWQEPERFDPDRFGRDRDPPPRHAYIPFGLGRFHCIGTSLAMVQLVTTLATLIRGARFRLREGQTVRPTFRVTLKPEFGLQMVVTPRADGVAHSNAAHDPIRGR